LFYSAVAHSKHSASHLSAAGEKYGDPFEISRQRREDFKIVAAKVTEKQRQRQTERETEREGTSVS